MKTTILKAARLALVIFTICCLSPNIVSAQWSTNPAINNAIVTDVNLQNANKIASDGSGGAIIAWLNRNVITNGFDTYAQRINSQGVIQWTTDGVAICTNPADLHSVNICSDGEGGAIIAWFDKRNVKNEVFAQKINAFGIVQWTVDGVSVGTVPSHYQQGSPALISDGSGGVIIAWADWRRDEFNDNLVAVHAQRISKSGSVMWGIGGIPLNNYTSSNNSNGDPDIISDNLGGAIVVWDKWIGPYPGGNRDVFAQKVNADGSLAWGTNSLTLCSATGDQNHPNLASDGNGGAIFVWEDFRNGSANKLYAQKVNAGGTIQWITDGLKISTNSSNYGAQRLASDGNGGAIVTWQGGTTVWVQHFNSDGVPQWTNTEVPIGGSANNPQIISDGKNGAFVTWENTSANITAQHINDMGTLLWGVYGLSVCSNLESQWGPMITNDGGDGIIISWDDYRNTLNTSTDIYAQQVSAIGTLGVVTGMDNIITDNGFYLYQNFPNPFIDETRIVFKTTTTGITSLKIFNASGIEVTTLVNTMMEAGDHTVYFNAKELPSGVYFYTLSVGIQCRTKAMVLLNK